MLEWRNGWYEIDNEDTCANLERELARELSKNPGHILYGKTFKVVGCQQRCDDVLIQLDSTTFAQVHLTYSVETNPAWPQCKILNGVHEVNQFIDGENNLD